MLRLIANITHPNTKAPGVTSRDLLLSLFQKVGGENQGESIDAIVTLNIKTATRPYRNLIPNPARQPLLSSSSSSLCPLCLRGLFKRGVMAADLV